MKINFYFEGVAYTASVSLDISSVGKTYIIRDFNPVFEEIPELIIQPGAQNSFNADDFMGSALSAAVKTLG